MPITKRGVYHNLKESKYVVSNGEITFFFSSMFYLNKFMDEHLIHRKEFKRKVERTLVDLPFDIDLYSDITLYKLIEKRGFRVILKGEEVTWKNLHLYVLQKRIDKSIKNWYVIPNQK